MYTGIHVRERKPWSPWILVSKFKSLNLGFIFLKHQNPTFLPFHGQIAQFPTVQLFIGLKDAVLGQVAVPLLSEAHPTMHCNAFWDKPVRRQETLCDLEDQGL